MFYRPWHNKKQHIQSFMFYRLTYLFCSLYCSLMKEVSEWESSVLHNAASAFIFPSNGNSPQNTLHVENTEAAGQTTTVITNLLSLWDRDHVASTAGKKQFQWHLAEFTRCSHLNLCLVRQEEMWILWEGDAQHRGTEKKLWKLILKEMSKKESRSYFMWSFLKHTLDHKWIHLLIICQKVCPLVAMNRDRTFYLKCGKLSC